MAGSVSTQAINIRGDSSGYVAAAQAASRETMILQNQMQQAGVAGQQMGKQVAQSGMNMKRTNEIVRQLGFGFSDFAAVAADGGITRGVAAAANNFGQLGNAISPLTGAIIGIAATAIPALILTLSKLNSAQEDSLKVTEKQLEAFQRLKAFQELLVEAEKGGKRVELESELSKLNSYEAAINKLQEMQKEVRKLTADEEGYAKVLDRTRNKLLTGPSSVVNFKDVETAFERNALFDRLEDGAYGLQPGTLQELRRRMYFEVTKQVSDQQFSPQAFDNILAESNVGNEYGVADTFKKISQELIARYNKEITSNKQIFELKKKIAETEEKRLSIEKQLDVVRSKARELQGKEDIDAAKKAAEEQEKSAAKAREKEVERRRKEHEALANLRKKLENEVRDAAVTNEEKIAAVRERLLEQFVKVRELMGGGAEAQRAELQFAKQAAMEIFQIQQSNRKMASRSTELTSALEVGSSEAISLLNQAKFSDVGRPEGAELDKARNNLLKEILMTFKNGNFGIDLNEVEF